MKQVKNTGKEIAFCGLMAALAVVIMMLFSLIGVGMYAGPFAASLVLVIVTEEYGARSALITYAAAALIGILIMPDRELAAFFLCYGWYPAGLVYINRIPSKTVRIAVKIGVYALIMAVMYGILAKLMGFTEVVTTEMKYFYGAVLVMGLPAFLRFDKCYGEIRVKWNKDWRKKVMR